MANISHIELTNLSRATVLVPSDSKFVLMASLSCHTCRHSLAASRRPLGNFQHRVPRVGLLEQRGQLTCRNEASSSSGGSASSGGSDSSSNRGSSMPNFGGKPVFSAFTSEEEWRVLDKKVNKYPGQRTFTAIGTGGEDFKANMLQAVESVTGPVHIECISDRPSSGGKYISVRVGPVFVTSPDQVIAVFANMRKDSRVRYYM